MAGPGGQSLGEAIFILIAIEGKQAEALNLISAVPRSSPGDVLSYRNNRGESSLDYAKRFFWTDVTQALLSLSKPGGAFAPEPAPGQRQSKAFSRQSSYEQPISILPSNSFAMGGAGPSNFSREGSWQGLSSSSTDPVPSNSPVRASSGGSFRRKMSVGEQVYVAIRDKQFDMALHRIGSLKVSTAEDLMTYTDQQSGLTCLELAREKYYIDIIKALYPFSSDAVAKTAESQRQADALEWQKRREQDEQRKASSVRSVPNQSPIGKGFPVDSRTGQNIPDFVPRAPEFSPITNQNIPDFVLPRASQNIPDYRSNQNTRPSAQSIYHVPDNAYVPAEHLADASNKGKPKSSIKTWFKTLTHGSSRTKGPDGDREYALIHHTYYAEFDSEFTSCNEGQEIEVVSRLPDSTVVIKSPKSGSRKLLPSFVFEPKIRVADPVSPQRYSAAPVSPQRTNPVSPQRFSAVPVSPQRASGNPLVNRAGAPVYPAEGAFNNTLYCGRFLGLVVMPSSEGYCGPSGGPQCPDCRASFPPVQPQTAPQFSKSLSSSSQRHKSPGELVLGDIVSNLKSGVLRRLELIPKNQPSDILTYRDQFGNTALSLASAKGWTDVVNVLKMYGDKRDTYGDKRGTFNFLAQDETARMKASTKPAPLYKFLVEHHEKRQFGNKLFHTNTEEAHIGEIIHDDIYHKRLNETLIKLRELDPDHIGDLLKYQDSRGLFSLEIAYEHYDFDPRWEEVVSMLEYFAAHVKGAKKSIIPAVKPVPKPAPPPKAFEEKHSHDIVVKITVHTGDLRGAGTDSNVTLVLHGTKGKSSSLPLKNSETHKDPFEASHLDVFSFKIPPIGDLCAVSIGHDSKGLNAPWFLADVVVDMEKKSTMFLCYKWFDGSKGDKKTTRTLRPRGNTSLKVTMNAWSKGTHSNVYLVLCAGTLESEEIPLAKSESGKTLFEKGKADIFNVQGTDVGKLTHIKIGDDGSAGPLFVANVTIEMSGKLTVFQCLDWIGAKEGHLRTIQPIPPQLFVVTVKTGSKTFAGTDANVYIILNGSLGKTQKRILALSSLHKDPFETGNTDSFSFSDVDVGKITDIVIGHDNAGLGASWFLDYVEVEYQGVKYNFPCNNWLAKDQGDGLIERRLNVFTGKAYTITTKTGKAFLSGTDADVYIILHGSRGVSKRMTLAKSATYSDPFEKGHDDIFHVQGDDVGDLFQIQIGHNNRGINSAWFLETVTIEYTGRRDFFCCYNWLESPTLERLIPVFVGSQYKVSVLTGSKSGSGTDANVAIQFCSATKKSTKVGLSHSNTYSDPFEKDHIDVFEVYAEDVGELQEIVIGHDNRGGGSAWFLGTVKVEVNNKTYMFESYQWFDRNQGDCKIERVIIANGNQAYCVSVKTGGKKIGSGTDANVYISFYGTKNRWSEQKALVPPKGIDPFESGKTDIFNVLASDVGELTKIRIGHDGCGLNAGWYLDNVVVETKGAPYKFICDRWLSVSEDDRKIERDLNVFTGKPYKISVKTGNKTGSGTNANVFINIFGTYGETGKKQLNKHNLENPDRSFIINLFETGNTDIFLVDLEDVGEIKRIVIEHDNTGMGSDWFLDNVLITLNRKSYLFESRQWFSTSEGDKLISRSIFACTTEYTVKVKTGGMKGAGMDANAYLEIHGLAGFTPRRVLEKEILCPDATKHKSLFNFMQEDIFKFKSIDVGTITAIVIGHDNDVHLGQADWFLDEVEITCNYDTSTFVCNNWLAKKKE